MKIETVYSKDSIKFVSITNDTGLEVTLSNYGASIYRIRLDDSDMVLTPKSYETFFHNGKYYGLTIGRIAGRVRNSLLKINDKMYQLEQNEGSNCLHGGYHSIAFKSWDMDIVNDDSVVVKFTLNTSDKEAGFNGNCKYTVSYKIYRDSNIIEVSYDAVCDEDTYINLTNHSYFNLGNEKDVLNHRLLINANEVSMLNEKDFCIDGYKSVDNSIHDFRKWKYIKDDINDISLHNSKWLNGYDHRYHLTGNIVLESKRYRLDISTDFDAVHVYTGGFTDADELINGSRDDVYKGVTMECTSLYPEYKKKGEHYVHHVRYSFKKN